MKIVDFHTHTFDEYVAARAIDKLSHSANICSYLNGTDKDLIEDNRKAGVELSVVLPVATRIMQSDGINSKNVRKNENYMETGLLFFAAIHPEDSNIRTRLANLKAAGFKGIKLHPVFQNAKIDDKCYLELIDLASEMDLITVIHAGEDISFPESKNASVKSVIKMIDCLHPRNLVLAHMGGWNEWNSVESDLAGADVYLDSSFCLNRLEALDAELPTCSTKLSDEQFLRIVKKHGVDKILFGTDSPWSERSKSVSLVKESGLTPDELEKIFYKNAKELLKV